MPARPGDRRQPEERESSRPGPAFSPAAGAGRLWKTTSARRSRAGVARGHLQVHVDSTRRGRRGRGLEPPAARAYVRAFREAAAAAPDRRPAARPERRAAHSRACWTTGQWRRPRSCGDQARSAGSRRRSGRRAERIPRTRRRRHGAAKCASAAAASSTWWNGWNEIRAGATAAFQKRLREKLADLLHGAGIDPQRLAQEAALAGRPQRYRRGVDAPADPRRATGRHPGRPTARWASGSIFCCRK